MATQPQSSVRARVIAAFDFDGTLTQRDTFIPFLAHVSWIRLLGASLIAAPVLAGYALRLCSNETAKMALCRAALSGRPRSALAEIARRWAPSIPLRPDMLARLRWHQQRGDHCVMVSASPDVYLEEAARYLGFDALLCTRMAVDPLGRLTGAFLGKNCWGPEKMRRLLEAYGPQEGYELHAYGDSRGDQWMIDAAEHAWYRGKVVKP
ncbi:HAD-IB family hydrolase [Achromobacter seleniivolatilans]|uniref:HAD-IB family hydrolase n=1 Tax=Achromobacter seleniivolatilans TaxID=3047478 RepID=A0ABY9LYA2_9BURK|nr:HAD-IB family hydrolase [Achromobacter sp. R39]WMD19763.1 HAD-IB family hydrolase [Achromobacter sp. R39]